MRPSNERAKKEKENERAKNKTGRQAKQNQQQLPAGSSARVGKLPSKEVLERLPESVRISVSEAAAFSGPLPPPSMYAGYNEVLPGSAERILSMAEKEQEHRINWEDRALETTARETALGQWLGFATGLACIASSIYLAMNDNQWVAGILAGVSVLGLVKKFIRGREG